MFMKQRRLRVLFVPSVVAGVLLLSVGGGSVGVGEDKTGAAVPDVVPQVAECAELLFEADFSDGNVP
jgi:hypothetical protein